MKPFVIGIADDVDAIHDVFTNFIRMYDSKIQIEHFYFATDVEDYLFENPDGLNLLFLDVQFDNSTSGIESLPNVRVYAPTLPIVLLTGLDLDFNELIAVSEKYNVGYIPKPLDSKQIAIKIENVKRQTADYKKLQKSQEELFDLLANGEIYKIKKYLHNSLSSMAQEVLNDLEVFIESVKLCSTFDIVRKNLTTLATSISHYDSYLSENSTLFLPDSEVIFGKIFNTIKKDINALLIEKDTSTVRCKIIKWCAKKRYVQQALTLYIEWLPIYLTESRIIIILDTEIINKCTNDKQSWETWQKHFLKAYKYKVKDPISCDILLSAKLEHKRIIEILKETIFLNTKYRHNKLKLLSNEPSRFGEFIKEVCIFSETVPLENFTDSVLTLNPNSYIKKVLQGSCPTNTTLINFLNARVKNDAIVENIILKSALLLPKNQLKEIFGIPHTQANNASSNNITLSSVEKNFNNMLRNKAISINVPLDNLITFTEQYRTFNNSYRNQINHANNTDENFSNLMNSIIGSVDLIDV